MKKNKKHIDVYAQHILGDFSGSPPSDLSEASEGSSACSTRLTSIGCAEVPFILPSDRVGKYFSSSEASSFFLGVVGGFVVGSVFCFDDLFKDVFFLSRGGASSVISSLQRSGLISLKGVVDGRILWERVEI